MAKSLQEAPAGNQVQSSPSLTGRYSSGFLQLKREAGADAKGSAATFSIKLEALRGLAALMVVGHHVFSTETYPWMHVPFNGGAAVSLFFVLSGYVLGLSLRRGVGTILRQYQVFLVRRIFRIYPVYFATTLAFLAYWYLYPFSPSFGPLQHFVKTQLGNLQLVKNFLFLDPSLNLVTWSLKVEMAGSIALPFLHFLTRNWRWPARLAFLLAMLLWGFLPSSGSTRQNLYMFYLGYLLVDIESLLPKWTPKTYAAITLVSGIAFLTARLPVGSWAGVRCGMLIEAIAAAALILSIQSGGGSLYGVLDRSWSHFAGRVSYSVFLIHTLIQDITINLMMGSPLKVMVQHGLAFWFTCLGWLLSTALALGVAWALYRWVESPFMKLGKSFSSSKGSV